LQQYFHVALWGAIGNGNLMIQVSTSL